MAQRYDGIYEVAKPEVSRMAVETGELANLMIEEQGYGIYIHTTSGDQAVALDTRLGKRIHLHKTAIGKALLSSFDDERVAEIIETRGLPAERTTLSQTARRCSRNWRRSENAASPTTPKSGLTAPDVSAYPSRRVTGERPPSASPPLSIGCDAEPKSADHRHGEQAANVIEVNLAHE